MYRVYITTVALQTNPEHWEEVLYEPQGFILENNIKTHFPIIPIIREESGELGDVRVIALHQVKSESLKGELSDLEKRNKQVLYDDLKKIGIAEDQIIYRPISSDYDSNSLMDTMFAVLDAIPDDSICSADITYGEKPLSVLVTMMMYAIENMKDVEAANIYYGKYYGTNREKLGLYNVSLIKGFPAMLSGISYDKNEETRELLRRIFGR